MNDPQPEGHMANYIRRRKFLAALLGAGAVAPEGSVKLGLSLGGVGKLISAPRPKVTAAERQVQLAHSVLTRAHEPPSMPAKRWSVGREKNLVVNFARFARPIVMNDVFSRSQLSPGSPTRDSNFTSISSS